MTSNTKRWTREVPCPHCGAAVDDECRTPSGALLRGVGQVHDKRHVLVEDAPADIDYNGGCRATTVNLSDGTRLFLDQKWTRSGNDGPSRLTVTHTLVDGTESVIHDKVYPSFDEAQDALLAFYEDGSRLLSTFDTTALPESDPFVKGWRRRIDGAVKYLEEIRSIPARSRDQNDLILAERWVAGLPDLDAYVVHTLEMRDMDKRSGLSVREYLD